MRIERRTEVPVAIRAIVPVLAVIGGLAVGALVLLLGNHSVSSAYQSMWQASFGTSTGFDQTLVQAIPLVFTGLAVTIALRMNVWNIGGEGQMALGAIGAAFVGFHFQHLAGLPLVLLMFLGGALAAAGWALIAALPRALVGLNEIITTLFLNYIGLLLLSGLINGPWKDPTVVGFAYSKPLPQQTGLPMIGTSAVSIGAYIALGTAVIVWWLLDRTRFGFSLRIAGGNVRAAQYLRLAVGWRIVGVLAISGVLAGIAGVEQLTTSSGRLQAGLTNNYGYTGILVAFLARQRVMPTVVVALLFAALLNGGSALQSTGIPSSISQIVQAIIIIFVLAGEVLGGYRVRRRFATSDGRTVEPVAGGSE
ncbi:MAG: ABC transporter permease [Actinomycetota bacterium]|nr:ABC transporter permease [Actinomycetota bacterium]